MKRNLWKFWTNSNISSVYGINIRGERPSTSSNIILKTRNETLTFVNYQNFKHILKNYIYIYELYFGSSLSLKHVSLKITYKVFKNKFIDFLDVLDFLNLV